jgi:hypothetical protein
MDEVPSHLIRYPTRAGRESLAARLGLTIDPHMQDWEWQIADARHFQEWLAIYRDAPLTDDERFSLMEMLVQCVEDAHSKAGSHWPGEQSLQWQAVAALLRQRPRLHASTIAYWSVFGADEPDHQFRTSQRL